MEKYIVKLESGEREKLISLTRRGKLAASKILHARILLESDEGSHTDPQSVKSTSEVSNSLGISEKTVTRLRKRFIEEGLEAALVRKKHSRTRPRKMTGEQEAHLVALCCSVPPQGRSRWTLKLLSSRLVQLEIIGSISAATVGRVLKKTNLNPGRSVDGVFQKPMLNLFGKWRTS